MSNTLFLPIEEDDDERQMKELSDSLPASELGHLWLNIRKYICVHVCKLNKLNEEENDTATISNFLHLFTLHEEVFIQHAKNNKLKIKKKTCMEAQSEGHALVHKSSESHLAD